MYFIIKTCNICIPETGKRRYVHKYLLVGNKTTTSKISVIFKYNSKYLLIDILKRSTVININYLYKL